MYDVIIIGAGPAGISASLYTRKSESKNFNSSSRKYSIRKNKSY